jgi:hypothetical protein
VTPGVFTPRPWPKGCGLVGFPLTSKFKLFSFATAVNSLPRVSRRTTGHWSSYLNQVFAGHHFNKSLPFRALSNHHHLGSGSLHPPFGVLFSFPSRYYCTIGLRTYLELGISVSHIHTRYPTRTTLECIPALLSYSYGTVTLSGASFQMTSPSSALQLYTP